jgi:hypothetical protein
VSSKTTTTSTIRAKIADLVAGRAKTEEQIAELERQARWAQGAERRARLEAVGAEASALADSAGDTATEIQAALHDVTAAVRRVHELGDAYNGALLALQAKLTSEGIALHSTGYGSVPPSPANGSIAPVANGVQVGERRIHTIATTDFVTRAVLSGQGVEDVEEPDLDLVAQAEPLTGRFWRVPGNGRIITADHQMSADLVEVSKIEYMASQWGLNLAELPADLLAELEGDDRARVAGRLLDELDGDERNQFMEQLLPARKESA